MLRVIVPALWVLVGCDKVLGLQKHPPVDAPTCAPQGGPRDDDDGDGVVNELDPCPGVANEDPNDEDADMAPDACDACPHIAGPAAGNDDDCDGIGAACDPDDTRAHGRRFYGFGEVRGFELYNTTLNSGAARLVVDDTMSHAYVRTQQPGTLPARLDLAVTIANARVRSYWAFWFAIEDGKHDYRLTIEKASPTHELSLGLDDKNRPVGEHRLLTVPFVTLDRDTVEISLRAEISADQLQITARIAGLGAPVLTAPALVTSPFTYSFALDRDPDPAMPSTTTATVPYFVYTAELPQ